MSIPSRLFIDACVLVAAAYSPEGGSARLLQLAQENKIKLVTTRLVLHETKDSITEFLGWPLWAWFSRIIGPLRLSLVDPSTAREKADCAQKKILAHQTARKP